MVPLGLFHIFFRLNSSTRASSGVIVAHLMPTLYFCRRRARVRGACDGVHALHAGCMRLCCARLCAAAAGCCLLLFAVRSLRLQQARPAAAEAGALQARQPLLAACGRAGCWHWPHLDRLCGVDGDLVVGRVAVGQAQVKVLDVQLQVRQDQLPLEQQKRGEKDVGSQERGASVSRCSEAAGASCQRVDELQMRACATACGCWRCNATHGPRTAAAHLVLDHLPDDAAEKQRQCIAGMGSRRVSARRPSCACRRSCCCCCCPATALLTASSHRRPGPRPGWRP